MFRTMLAPGAAPLALAAAPIFTLVSPPAHAESAASADSERKAVDILVVGQRDAPISIEPRGLSVSLGDEQFAGINAQNVEDLMKYAPDFFVRKRYAGDSNGVPGFRGTHSTQSARTLVMVDGFTVSNFLGNSFNFSPKWGVVGPGEVRQFDVVYGPYAARYSGNSMGGIVNITTRSPDRAEAFATVQGLAETYDQFGTHETYRGYSAEAGFGLRQREGPWSLRLSGRHFRNDGQPMSFYGLTPASGPAPGTPVTGALVDPGQAIANAPGLAASPIFAAQSPAAITQDQAKLRLGYDGASGVIGEALVAYWHNRDSQTAPDCYLRDTAGQRVCEGRVTTPGGTYTASGAKWSRTVRDELLAGIRLAAPLSDTARAEANLSTYQILRSDGFTSASYAAGQADGAGTLARQGPTAWYTGEIMLAADLPGVALSAGGSANLYRTDLINYTLANWRRDAGKAFASRTYGKTRDLAVWAEARVPLDPVTLTLGARFEDWRAFDGGIGRIGTGGRPVQARYATRRATAFQPKLSAEWAIAPATLLQLSLAKATRFPTVGELYQGSLNGDGSFNPDSFDPNLKPERSTDANLLLARDFGPVKLTGSAFWQRVRNTIFAFTGFNQNGVTTASFKNIDVTRQYGIELIAEARDLGLPGLDLDANAAWIDSITVRNASAPAAQGVQFPRIPRWRLNANLRYRVSEPVLVAIGMRYASRPNTDLFGLQRGDTFGYTSELFALDAKVNWAVTDRLRLSAGVDNITNNRAWVYHPYPQRSFLLEAGWRL
ncbi:TonB-dependent receptor [Novosphingobium album (ex Liu et al. 2023)]|uniref:TonB-dependent receptor n=1 Tax=Novosphingobium album (ex Liu et al. 2023) TaxID=3031130 RepID=A0ABT5WRI8_9SPHN|nr:TonB-dependent receptor [Novosphingobium album (ex Liu et al. 2023)]MDE8652656.1 TonB-dependent receptor [Novosphingobium album (ex Liu et al. 2023)]